MGWSPRSIAVGGGGRRQVWTGNRTAALRRQFGGLHPNLGGLRAGRQDERVGNRSLPKGLQKLNTVAPVNPTALDLILNVRLS